MSESKDITIHPSRDADLKKHIELVISGAENEVELDTDTFSSSDRAIIHEYCRAVGLYTMSTNSRLGKKIKVMKTQPTHYEVTDEDVEFFVKQGNLPVVHVSIDTIEYYLKVLSPYFDNCLESYRGFVKEVQSGLHAQSEMSKVFRLAIEYIQEKESYQALRKNPPKLDRGEKLKTSLYQTKNVGKRFLSIDVEKGNFSVLKKNCPDIFSGSWYNFVSQFTDSEFIRRSKRIREVVFGNLGFSKLANSLQEHEITAFYNHLYKHYFDIADCLISKCGDEMIFELDDDIDIDKLNEVIGTYPDTFYHIRYFTLRAFDDTPYFYKEYDNGSIEPRMVPKRYMMQVLKHFEEQPITELDLTFTDKTDGHTMVATYKHSIFDKVK